MNNVRNYEDNSTKVLLGLNSKNVLDKENIETIICNLPKIGEDTINRICLSNSEIISKYSGQFIGKIAQLPPDEAIKKIEEF